LVHGLTLIPALTIPKPLLLLLLCLNMLCFSYIFARLLRSFFGVALLFKVGTWRRLGVCQIVQVSWRWQSMPCTFEPLMHGFKAPYAYKNHHTMDT
jgi:hypothetical protein